MGRREGWRGRRRDLCEWPADRRPVEGPHIPRTRLWPSLAHHPRTHAYRLMCDTHSSHFTHPSYPPPPLPPPPSPFCLCPTSSNPLFYSHPRLSYHIQLPTPNSPFSTPRPRPDSSSCDSLGNQSACLPQCRLAARIWRERLSKRQ